MDNKQITELLTAYKNGTIKPSELAMLESWYNHQALQDTHEIDDRRLLDNVNLIGKKLPLKYPVHTAKIWPRIAAVAATLVLIAGIAITLNRGQNQKDHRNIVAVQDMPAGANNAYITFGTDKKIALSSQKSGLVINASNLSYNDGTNIQANTGKDITVSTPLGGTYQVVLPDQSKVWLNAGSSIKFPSSFANLGQRNVVLTGEAYFEIYKDKKHPFVVKSSGQEIKVLGTHFNINSYAEDKVTKTTLLEGSVQINGHTIIKPGEQAVGLGNAIFVAQADTEEAIAWKNGYFKFNENLESIMYKVGRWYNAEIIYQFKPDPKLTFSGKISRTKNLSDVLKMIEFNGDVHFKIEGRRITVMK